MNLEEKARNGKKAEHLLKDPTLREAIKDLVGFYQNEIITTKARETRKREDCYRMLKCIEQFEKVLLKRIDIGKIAESTLSQVANKVKKLTRTEY